MVSGRRWLFCLVALIALKHPVRACCTAYDVGHPVRLVGEQVIIVWDAKNKLQHFIRQASFDGDAKDFGFIVPTPTKPEVAEADEKAFERLSKLIPPEPAGGDAAAAPAFDSKGEVEVLDQYRVGDYMATIVKASDGSALMAWLKENGYSSRPAMEAWLDHYAKQNWVFTALKFVRSSEQSDAKTTALRLSFKTEVPHYPYKMPTDTWPEGHYRPLTLYFVATGEPTAIYRGSQDPWEAEKRWSGPLPPGQIAGLAKEIGLRQEDLPDHPMVTILQNTENENGYERDLDFMIHSPNPPMAVLAIFGLGGAAALYVGLKLLSARRKIPAPA